LLITLLTNICWFSPVKYRQRATTKLTPFVLYTVQVPGILCFLVADALVASQPDPSKLSLAERVRLFNGLSDQVGGNVVSRPPPRGGAATGQQQQQVTARRGRRKLLNHRYQTQPITVDEVEKARRGFFSHQAHQPPPSFYLYLY
jgi:hypothetical protein